MRTYRPAHAFLGAHEAWAGATALTTQLRDKHILYTDHNSVGRFRKVINALAENPGDTHESRPVHLWIFMCYIWQTYMKILLLSHSKMPRFLLLQDRLESITDESSFAFWGWPFVARVS